MCEEEGFEAASDFSLSTLENEISIRELKSIVSDKEWQFIRLILFGFDFPGHNRNKRSIFNFNLPYGQKFFN